MEWFWAPTYHPISRTKIIRVKLPSLFTPSITIVRVHLVSITWGGRSQYSVQLMWMAPALTTIRLGCPVGSERINGDRINGLVITYL